MINLPSLGNSAPESHDFVRETQQLLEAQALQQAQYTIAQQQALQQSQLAASLITPQTQLDPVNAALVAAQTPQITAAPANVSAFQSQINPLTPPVEIPDLQPALSRNLDVQTRGASAEQAVSRDNIRALEQARKLATKDFLEKVVKQVLGRPRDTE